MPDVTPVRLASTEAPAPPSEPIVRPAPERISQPAPLPLSLFDAIETSLQQNPDLVALRRNEGVSLGLLGVARTYPFNPYVQIQATPGQWNPGGVGPGTIYHYVLVMQTVQLAHQQRYRTANALAALTSVRWNILQAELVNVAQTERLYFTALYQRGIRDLTRASAELNNQLLDVGEKQLRAGQVSAADVAIVRLDAQSTRRQSQLAEANYRTAELDLRRQLALPLELPLDLNGSLADFRWSSAEPQRLAQVKCAGSTTLVSSDSQAVISDLVAGRPDVLAARADVAAARANVDWAQALRVPDLQIGPYYQRTETSTTYVGFRAQSDIPIINNGVPLVRQRVAESRQRQVVWEQLHTRALIEAQTAIDRYERALRLASEPVSGDLPKELQALEEEFKSQEVDIVRIFTARTSLIQARRAQLDLLNELAQAAANVTQATAVAPQHLVRPADVAE